MTTKPFYMFTYKFKKNRLDMDVKADDYHDALAIAIEASKYIDGELEFIGSKPSRRKSIGG